MKHDNHGCARIVFGGMFIGLTICATFFLLLTAGFRAAPIERPAEREGATTLVVHEPGRERIETTSDGTSLTARSRYTKRGPDSEELRLVWRTDGVVDPALSGTFDAGGKRLRALSPDEAHALDSWRPER